MASFNNSHKTDAATHSKENRCCYTANATRAISFAFPVTLIFLTQLLTLNQQVTTIKKSHMLFFTQYLEKS